MRMGRSLAVSVCVCAVGCADVWGFRDIASTTSTDSGSTASGDDASDGAAGDGSTPPGIDANSIPANCGATLNPAACDTCAREYCCTPEQQCADSPDCRNCLACDQNCVATCNTSGCTSTCEQNCATQYPSGCVTYETFGNCQKTNCLGVCVVN
jgi:hypothetical protein